MQVRSQLKTTYEDIRGNRKFLCILQRFVNPMLVLMLDSKEILYLSILNNPKRLQIKC
jgi:hypothetical protein